MIRSEDRTLLYLFARLMIVIVIIGIPAGLLIGAGISFLLQSRDPLSFVIGAVAAGVVGYFWRAHELV